MKSTDDIIRQIKDGTLREDASVELKQWLPNKDVLAKVLVGLANAGGGHFFATRAQVVAASLLCSWHQPQVQLWCLDWRRQATRHSPPPFNRHRLRSFLH